MRWLWIIVIAGGISILDASLVAQESSQENAQESAPAPQSPTEKPAAAKENPGAGESKAHRSKPSGATTGSTQDRSAAKRAAASSQSDHQAGGPRKIVVRQGGAEEPAAQIVTDMPPEDATRMRDESERLLTSAGESMKRLAGRSLDEQQQETVLQIDHYIDVARSALKQGDISRGHTLALKASLLADDVAKH
jgi:hypothetical protein